MKVVLLFSQVFLDFRIAELKGIIKALNLEFPIDQIDVENHIFVIDIDDVTTIHKLLSRSMLLKSAYEFFYVEESYDDLLRVLEANKPIFKKYDTADQSFSMKVRPVGRKRGLETLPAVEKVCECINLELAPVSLNEPDNAFVLLEDYENEKSKAPRRIFFNKLIGHGQYRLKSDFNLRDRCYIGNTTMDPELSFIQANITGVKNGDLVLDPFVGTGGLILSAAKFGASVFGTEINYQIAKGLGKSSRQGVKFLTEKESIAANFQQYGMSDKLMSIIIADASQHGVWRDSPMLDGIVSDPPYGVREKGRKIGKKERKEHWTLPGSEHAVSFPEKQKYSLEATFTDLCDISASVLRIGARVSFWFPVILESYSTDCLPYHPAMILVENCEQRLTRKTSRRLLTYEKVREPKAGEVTTTSENIFEKGTFRDVIFVGNN
ncbi:unnamed protein product [Auanema sp. JU1783]|nr:unnamed protein product [Auanema sp. JU1783]